MNTKICKICKQEKDINSFYKRPDGYYEAYCKKCDSIRKRNWKIKNPLLVRHEQNQNVNRTKQKRDALKIIVNKEKTKGCVYCGYKQFFECLQFHHLDASTKENGIGVMISNRKTISEILEEIKKCVVLCANCHTALHNGDIKL